MSEQNRMIEAVITVPDSVSTRGLDDLGGDLTCSDYWWWLLDKEPERGQECCIAMHVEWSCHLHVIKRLS